MRVAIVQEDVDARRGGAETSTLEMAQHLARSGVHVTILHRAQPGDAETSELWDDEVHHRPIPATGFTRAVRTYQFVQGVNRVCRAERFDIVHAVTPCLCANVYQPRGGTYAETVARSTAMPPAWSRDLRRLGRRFNIRQRFLMRIEQMLLRKRRARVVVAALSHYVRQQIVALGFPPERVRVVFNGVDVAPPVVQDRARARAELGLTELVPVVLFAAHNFRLKGLSELLRATAQCGRDWVLVVAGRDRRGPYERLARRLRIDRRVRFVGTSTPIPTWYLTADVLAHPTWYDPCSRVVLEALSHGLPVVTTRHNGAAEIMEAGRHGVVIDEPDDRASLAAAIALASQPALRSACQADAPRLRAQLSMARHARELVALYEDVLRGCAVV